MTHIPNPMTIIFKINFHSSQSSWGFTSPELNYQPHRPPFPFPDSSSYPPFPEPPIEEKSSLQRTLEEAIEAQKQFENMMASSCPQNFQIHSSFPEILKEKSL